MTIVIIIIAVLLLLILMSGLIFEYAIIRRGATLKAPGNGGKGVVSPMLAPTGEELWAYNIPKHKAFKEMETEDVFIRSNDGLKLVAKLHRGDPDVKTTVICFHGYKSAPIYDFCAISEMYRDMGVTLIFPHMRAHGESEGKYIGFGALDSDDVLLWVKKARELFPENDLFLHGVSMGAASIMQASDRLSKDDVRGIIADCGYSSAGEVFKNLVWKLVHLPAFPFINIFECWNRLLAGYDFSSHDSRKSLAKTELPFVYICGDSDQYVPIDMAHSIFDSCKSEKYLLISKGTGHAANYMRETEKYTALVGGFIKDHGGKNGD